MRPLALLGALLLSACSTDVFVGPDSGDGASADASQDAAEGGGPTLSIECAKGTCTDQICCQGTTWDLATCSATSSQNTLSCQHFLSCDDPTDCPANQPACCAAQISTTGAPIITSSHCAADCPSGAVRLCQSNTDCSTKNCQDYVGAPSWVKTCQ